MKFITKTMSSYFKISILLVIFAILSGCGGGNHSSSPPDNGHGSRDWTVMLYMAADNELDTYAIKDMNELERVGSTSQVSIVAQVDRYTKTNGDWDTTRRYYITHDNDSSKINSQLIQDMGELDMAAPQTLSDFIEWATQTYPAEHYLLVLWDHGRGWRTSTLLAQPRQVRTINIDDTSGTEMDLSELHLGLQHGTRADIILFDACLMSMAEVSYAIRDCADIMVASEENVPADGQPYTDLLTRIAWNSQMGPVDVSRAIVDEYIKYYSKSIYSENTFTMSAIDLASLDGLAAATDQFAEAIIANLGDIYPYLGTARSSAQRYDYDNNRYTDYKDLYDFSSKLSVLSGNTQISTAAQQVMAAVKDTILYERHLGANMANSHGISIYLPEPGSMLAQYRGLEFTRDTRWDELLASY